LSPSGGLPGAPEGEGQNRYEKRDAQHGDARSLGTIGRLVLGSVGTKVMHEAQADVLVVK
jgi:hypothetical protein